MHRYLRQLTQISIINFFFILMLLFFIQRKESLLSPHKKLILQNPSITAPTSQATSSATQTNIIQAQATPTPIAGSTQKNLFSDLSIHNSKSDCWLAVQGHVYDVTTYFGSHPGGDGVIQKYCGTDATIPFTTKDGIGANHSATAYDLLHQYLIQ